MEAAATVRPEDARGSAPDAGATAGDDMAITRIREAWPTILERLAASSRVAWTAFHGATPVSCTNGALAVAVAEPGNVRAIAQRGHDERLRQVLIDVLALDLSIDVLHDPEPARPAPPDTAGRPAAHATARGTPTASGPAAAGGTPRGASPGGAHPTAPAGRPADVVREAGSAPAEADVADEPSPDDPDLDPGGAQGLALITRELGARPIGEIDHS